MKYKYETKKVKRAAKWNKDSAKEECCDYFFYSNTTYFSAYVLFVYIFSIKSCFATHIRVLSSNDVPFLIYFKM